MDLLLKLQERAKKHHAKIGIGMANDSRRKKIIENSIESATDHGYADVVTYDIPRDLISALKTGEISGALRGDLPAKETISELKVAFKVVSIYRAALLSIDEKHSFFLAPVGIDEGIFIDERFEFIKLIDSLLQRVGIASKTAIISGGRLPEDVGRSGVVDESLRAGEKLFKLAKDARFDAKHYGVLIEDAYKDSNIIIAPNGIVGNLLFRTMHYLGNCRSLGAPILNLDKVFIDTSRRKQDYTDSIMMASALSGL